MLENASMKKYTLKTELQTTTELMLTVPANNPKDAVRLAGEAVSGTDEPVGGALYPAGGEILNASFKFEKNFEFNERMIIGTSKIDGEEKAAAAADIKEAARFLIGKGYRYQGEEKDLAGDPRPLFMKSVWTADERAVVVLTLKHLFSS